jgi:WXG100 family type VII secretion target
MSIEGMDTNQLEGLAKQIDSNSQALYNLVNSINGVIGALIFSWNGPAATTFEHDWQNKNRPALLNAHNILANLHSELIKNIDQQKSASAQDSGWSVGSVIGGLWQKKEEVEEKTRIPEYLVNKEKEIFGHSDPSKGHNPWTWLEKHTPEDPVFPYFKDTKVVRWLHDTPVLREADHLLGKTYAYKVLDKVVEPAALVASAASVGVDLYQAGDAAVHGNAHGAADHFTDAEADAVGTVPVLGWMADFDTELAKADINQIINGGPIPTPFSWQNLREDYAPLPGEMWRELGQDKKELVDMALGGHGPDE